MSLFKRKEIKKSYDQQHQKPIIHASICSGEQVAGFKDLQTGKIEEIMLLQCPEDLEKFRKMYGITGEIEKEY